MSLHRKGPENGSLRASVKASLEAYFEQLDGHDAEDVFALVMAEVEVPMLQVVLARTGGNQSEAARVLGINRGTLRKKLSQYGLLS